MNNMTKTKNKINPKVAVTSIVIVLIIVASLVTAAVLPIFNPGGNAYSKTISFDNEVPHEYCVYGNNTNTAAGSYLPSGECQKQPTSTYEGETFPGYLIYCPGLIAPDEPKGGETYCNCALSSEAYTMASHISYAQSSRDNFSDNFNNGEWTTRDKIDDRKNKLAAVVDCSCDVIASDKSATIVKDNAGNPIKISANDETLYKMNFLNAEVQGTQTLMQELSKLFNKMTKFNKTTRVCETDSFPTNCSITSSYDGGRANSNSRHTYGEAVDISCRVAVGNNTGCTGDTLTALDLIKKYNSSFDIIQECTAYEKSNCGDGGATQIIHLDLGDPDRRGNDAGTNCEWIGCQFGQNGCNPPNNN